MLTKLVESANRPGVLGTVGGRIERRTAKELGAYFSKLRSAVVALKLENLVRDGVGESQVAHMVDMRMHNTLRINRHLLLGALSTNIMAARLAVNKIDVMKESDAGGLDRVGETATDAADYAAEYSAQLVTGLDNTTKKWLANYISDSIVNQRSVAATARGIRDLMTDMTTSRARMIASTEINDAMSQATLAKLNRIGASYKQLIADAEACPICASIEDAGPVPLNDPFVDEDGEEYDATPIHPGCRCATTGARAPQ